MSEASPEGPEPRRPCPRLSTRRLARASIDLRVTGQRRPRRRPRQALLPASEPRMSSPCLLPGPWDSPSGPASWPPGLSEHGAAWASGKTARRMPLSSPLGSEHTPAGRPGLCEQRREHRGAGGRPEGDAARGQASGTSQTVNHHDYFVMFAAPLIFCQKMLTSRKVLKSVTIFQFVQRHISYLFLGPRDTALHHPVGI